MFHCCYFCLGVICVVFIHVYTCVLCVLFYAFDYLIINSCMYCLVCVVRVCVYLLICVLIDCCMYLCI